MPITFAKKPAASKSHEGTLRYHLHKHLSAKREGRPYGNIHASEVTGGKFCSRERIIQMLNGGAPMPEKLSTSLAVTFQIGKDLQDRVVQWLGETGVGYADWICRSCGYQWKMAPFPKGCPNCVHPLIKYEERRVKSTTSLVSGGVDAFYKRGNLLTPVEVKTMDKDEFKKLIMPLAEHQVRTKLYLKLIDESDDPDKHRMDTTFARVLYVSKGGFGTKAEDVLTWKLGDSGFSPFKEYEVKRDDLVLDTYIDPVMKHHENKAAKIMPHRVCKDAGDPRSFKCPAKGLCFGSKYPEGEPYGC